MANEDIRWIQRFNNYRKALAKLCEAVALAEERDLTDLEQQGLIQGFEFTFDLAWKTLQDYLRHHKRPNDNGGPNALGGVSTLAVSLVAGNQPVTPGDPGAATQLSVHLGLQQA